MKFYMPVFFSAFLFEQVRIHHPETHHISRTPEGIFDLPVHQSAQDLLEYRLKRK